MKLTPQQVRMVASKEGLLGDAAEAGVPAMTEMSSKTSRTVTLELSPDIEAQRHSLEGTPTGISVIQSISKMESNPHAQFSPVSSAANLHIALCRSSNKKTSLRAFAAEDMEPTLKSANVNAQLDEGLCHIAKGKKEEEVETVANEVVVELAVSEIVKKGAAAHTSLDSHSKQAASEEGAAARITEIREEAISQPLLVPEDTTKQISKSKAIHPTIAFFINLFQFDGCFGAAPKMPETKHGSASVHKTTATTHIL
eukprot:CAMPEP_0119343486 /NCGR_PEP_ID=MMETSP1333-20130426/106472_1 /TAXON_ID=418940 /ORGANISM="Scyphosphaera apsteinii, Strain RCC1455" /LENGTH=254 /DNA_ID=CAMNT_0007355877 /DNA_START=270 /DNA_END=1034 /DNA_ORIENTATION=+